MKTLSNPLKSSFKGFKSKIVITKRVIKRNKRRQSQLKKRKRVRSKKKRPKALSQRLFSSLYFPQKLVQRSLMDLKSLNTMKLDTIIT